MKRIRVIPALLLDQGRLVKTQRFTKPTYVGDPVNTVKIFNDKQVDELLLLDMTATRGSRAPDVALIGEIASECFMPLAYGGGITALDQAREIFATGVEKIVLNTALHTNPELIREIAGIYGSQAVVASIDVRRGRFFGKQSVVSHGGRQKTGIDPLTAAKKAVALGAGEIIITSVDQDGTMQGYDTDLVRSVAEAVTVPVVANGGAGSMQDFVEAITLCGASAVAAGALFVFKGPHRAVLVNYPSQQLLKSEVYENL